MERFRELKSLAGILQPGDATRYEMVAVVMPDHVAVVVMNDSFFNKIMFVNGEYYTSSRGISTNPWTIKAAKEMFNMLINEEMISNGGENED
jgi:tRNA U54 and U55 pseudouridine synthase Pus10